MPALPTSGSTSWYSWAAAVDGNALRGGLVNNVKDWGVIGDGTSRPLSTLYGSLAAAQAVYPSAVALTDELDWAATQSMLTAKPAVTFRFDSSLHLITNKPLRPGKNTRWELDGIIENIAARNTPSQDQYNATVIQPGNMHPVVLNTGVGDGWPTFALNDINAGDRVVTVTTPGAISVPLAVGDFVFVRSNTNPVTTGATGVIYDYVQLNKVQAWNSGTGQLTLELPIRDDIKAAATLTGPTLCLNSGNADSFTGLPWSVLEGWRLTGRGRLVGCSSFLRMGMWRGHIDIAADVQNLVQVQCSARSYVRVRGTYTNRLLEVKFANWESEVIASGSYVYDSGVTAAATTVSIGEQATGNDITIDATRGSEHTANVRLVEEWGVDNRVRLRAKDYSTGGQSQVMVVKSTANYGRPPSNLDLDANIRTSDGKTEYLRFGDVVNLAAGQPTRIRYRLNARSSTTAPTNLVYNQGATVLVQGDVVADVLSGGADAGMEMPERVRSRVATVSGAPTYAAGSSTLIGGGNITYNGPKVGDYVDCSLQLAISPTSGTWGDLIGEAVVQGSNQLRIYVRNRSATAVVFPTGNVFFVNVTWQRRRN